MEVRVYEHHNKTKWTAKEDEMAPADVLDKSNGSAKLPLESGPSLFTSRPADLTERSLRPRLLVLPLPARALQKILL